MNKKLNAEENKLEAVELVQPRQQRWVMHLSYFGHKYSGWQVQPNSETVQGVLNAALKKLLRHEVASMGCGRTDTGVHAKQFYMHFNTDAITDVENFVFRLNGVLPEDIAVHEMFRAKENANTRFDAVARTYEYFIHFPKNAFLNKYSLFQGYYPIDWECVAAASEVLCGVKDFTSLCLPSEDFKTNICHLSQARWDVISSPEKVLKPYEEGCLYKPIHELHKQDFGVRFTITSNRFLRGMVRTIVGTLLMVGKKKISVELFKETVLAQEKFRVQLSAPARGLYLSQVKYPEGYPAV